MNETEYILLGVTAFGLGWYIAYLVKNADRVWLRWGVIVGFLILYLSFFFTVFLSVIIVDLNNVAISALVGMGFLIRFFTQKEGA